MSDDVVRTLVLPNFAPPAVQALEQMCTIIADSQYVPMTSPSDIFLVVMYGQELGLPPMTALHTIRFIDGKPAASGQALLTLLRRAGVEVDMPNPAEISDVATVRVRRRSTSPYVAYSYTRAMAEAAGVWNLDNWQRQPAIQLMWRALSNAARMVAPDVVGDLQTIEELDPTIRVDATGAPIGLLVLGASPEPSPASTEQENEPTLWSEAADAWTKFTAWLTDKRQLTLESAADLVGLSDHTATAWGNRFESGKAACVAIEEALKARAEQPATPKAEWVPEVVETAQQVYNLSSNEMLKIVGKKAWTDFPDKASAENTMHRTAVERQLPVVSSRVCYAAYGKGGKAIEFETPGIILRLPGGREALVEKLGADGQTFRMENSLTIWEIGSHYDIDPVKIVWSKNQKGVVTIESLSMVTPYPAEDEPVEQVEDTPPEPEPA